MNEHNAFIERWAREFSDRFLFHLARVKDEFDFSEKTFELSVRSFSKVMDGKFSCYAIDLGDIPYRTPCRELSDISSYDEASDIIYKIYSECKRSISLALAENPIYSDYELQTIKETEKINFPDDELFPEINVFKIIYRFQIKPKQ